jgi:hypothetical protein
MGGANGPVNQRGFVARLSQADCDKGRKRVSPCLGIAKPLGDTGQLRGKHANYRVVRVICTRNRGSGSGVFSRARRAQNPRFRTSKRGKIRARLSRAGENSVWNGAQRGHMSPTRDGTRVAREQVPKRATRRDPGGSASREGTGKCRHGRTRTVRRHRLSPASGTQRKRMGERVASIRRRDVPPSGEPCSPVWPVIPLHPVDGRGITLERRFPNWSRKTN